MRGNVSYGGSKSLQWALSCEGNSPGKKIDAVFGSAVWCHKLPGHWSMGVWDSRRTSFSHSSSLESAAEPEWKCHRCTLLSAAYRVAWIQHRFVYLLVIFFSSSFFFFYHEERVEPGGLYYARRCFGTSAPRHISDFDIVWMLFIAQNKTHLFSSSPSWGW